MSITKAFIMDSVPRVYKIDISYSYLNVLKCPEKEAEKMENTNWILEMLMLCQYRKSRFQDR